MSPPTTSCPGSGKTGRDEGTPRYIVDASVVAKWILQGAPYQENAIKLKEEYVSGSVGLSSLCLVVKEVASALWKAIKQDRISEEDAKEALMALDDLKIELHELSWAQTAKALGIACELGLTVYDASYVYLSEEMGLPLITADRALQEKAGKRFKILYIGDYS